MQMTPAACVRHACRYLVATIGLASLACAPAGAAIPRSDLLVASGWNETDHTSRIVRVDPATGEQSLVSDNATSLMAGGQPLFQDVTGIYQQPGTTGYALVTSGEDRDNTGRIIRVSTVNGRQELISDNARSAAAGGIQALGMPHGLAMTPDGSGDIVVANTNLAAAAVDQGTILRIDASTGRQTLLSDDAKSAARGGDQDFARGEPMDVAIGLDDAYYAAVCDPENPVIKVDPGSGKQTTVTDAAISARSGGEDALRCADGIAVSRSGDLVVADATNRVVAVDPSTGAQRTVTSAGELDDPHAVGVVAATGHVDGEVVVVNEGTDDGTGTLLAVDPVTGTQSEISSNGISALAGGGRLFARPFDITQELFPPPPPAPLLGINGPPGAPH
ncbi:hypothetical protein AYO39_01085 [Actinobacteria bacterium SCGC AG-212-D09]|nr:hypothetical protein AYO39_01085 [Actinobacteria bacterium SCGC AG-212-D09]